VDFLGTQLPSSALASNFVKEAQKEASTVKTAYLAGLDEDLTRSAPILQNGLVNWLVSFDSTVSPMVAFLLFMPLQMDCVCLFAHFIILSFLCPMLFGLGFVLFDNWLTPLLIMQVQQLAIHAMLGLRLKQLAQVVASQLVLSYLTVRLSISICQGCWVMLVHAYSVMKMLNCTAWSVKRVCS
jgi:hypothetical protein